jgi:hypothetical protein
MELVWESIYVIIILNDAVQKITGMYVDPIQNDLKRKASHIILYYYFIKKIDIYH